MTILTWRISDAIEPKLSYIAKAPWDREQEYAASYDIYHEYATKNYGAANADAVTAIINENEPFAENHGECRQTPHFTGSNRRAEQGPVFELAHIMLTHGESGKLSAKVPAVNYAVRRGSTLRSFKSEDHGEYVRNIVCGDWLLFNDVDFGAGATAIALEGKARNDLDVEVRLDGPKGRLLGICDVAGSARWETTQSDIEAASESNTLCLRFLLKEKNEAEKASSQLAVVDGLITNCQNMGQKNRLGLLRSRLASVKHYLEVDEHFPWLTWDELPGAMDVWVGDFIAKVHDVSTLGNMISIQNRFVKQHYVTKVNGLRKKQEIKSPSFVTARGTTDGAVIRWTNEQPTVHGFYVYRDGERVNQTLLPADARTYTDQFDGTCVYRVTAVGPEGKESPRSIPGSCSAGAADKDGPRVIVISPPTSGPIGQPVDVVARVIDGRVFEGISATLYFRKPAEPDWRELPMARQAKTIFAARIPGQEVSEAGLEYYVTASDGTNTGHFPAEGSNLPASLVGYTIKDTVGPNQPLGFDKSDRTLRWQSSGADVYWYQIYRSQTPDFQPGPASLLTYVPPEVSLFTDSARDRYGRPLHGAYYYCVVAIDEAGNESRPTPVIKVTHK